MKFLVVIGILIICIIVLDKWYERLPKPLQLLYDLWEKFAHALGAVMSRVILTILWIIGFGPYALVYKLTRKKEQPKETYWIDVPEDTHANLRHQF